MKQRIIFWLVVLAGCALLFALFLNVPYVRFERPELVVDRQSTFFSGPLMEDGTVDYAGVINQHFGQGATRQNNLVAGLFPFFEDAFFDLETEELYWRALGFNRPPEKIEMPDLPALVRAEKDKDLVTPNDLEESRIQFEEESRLVSKPWKSSDLPLWAAQISDHQRELDLLVQVSKRTHCFEPLVHAGSRFYPIDSYLVPAGSVVSNGARQLMLRAMNRIGDGEIALAIEDAKAVRRMACLFQTCPFLPSRGISGRAFSLAIQVEEALLNADQVTSKQLADYQSFLRKHLVTFRFTDQLNVTMRARILNSLQLLQIDEYEALRHMIGVDQETGWLSVAAPVLRSANLVEAMKGANQICDQFVLADRVAGVRPRYLALKEVGKTLMDTADELERPDRFVKSMFRGPINRGQLVGYFLFLEQFGATDYFLQTVMNAFESDRLMDIAFTAAIFQKTNGSFPDGLEDLASFRQPSESLTELKKNKRIRYRKTEDGFIVFSPGQDDKFDDGLRSSEIAAYNKANFNGQTIPGDLRVAAGTPPQPQTGSQLYYSRINIQSARKRLAKERAKEAAAKENAQQATHLRDRGKSK